MMAATLIEISFHRRDRLVFRGRMGLVGDAIQVANQVLDVRVYTTQTFSTPGLFLTRLGADRQMRSHNGQPGALIEVGGIHRPTQCDGDRLLLGNADYIATNVCAVVAAIPAKNREDRR